MISPLFWYKHARAQRALKNYPIYDVPHKRAEGELPEREAQENFDYFMRVRLQRLAFFQDWLCRNFSVTASLDGDGVRAVSRWVDDYGGGLIGDDRYVAQIFDSYQPHWEGRYAGYNVMIDLGIFLGEYLVSKRPRLHWEIYRGHEVEPETIGGPSYMRPHLGGMPRGWGCEVLRAGGAGPIVRSREESHLRFDGRRRQTGGLIEQAKSALYCSRLPDGDDPIIIGDSSNEPL